MPKKPSKMRSVRAWALLNTDKEIVTCEEGKTPYIRMNRIDLIVHRCPGEEIVQVEIYPTKQKRRRS